MTLTVTDLFCGAGGSALGGSDVPGISIRMAANHWALAVETHAKNFPKTDHDLADISQVNPRRYPRTNILWASPECTNHSSAKGRKVLADAQPDLFGEVLPDAAAERSRATMWDVLRFGEYHEYDGIIVENVVDVRKWVLWPSWVTGLRNLGYDFEVVYMNSMYAQGAGLPAPQSRDRLYVVAWRTAARRPNFERWARPLALCPKCEQYVRAAQAWKSGDKASGKYREQYVWRCPDCRVEVHPAILPAASAIDWVMSPGPKIGERDRPLAGNTRARIGAGLRRYARPVQVEIANGFAKGNYNRAWPLDSEPFRTLPASPSKGIACPPLIVDRQNTTPSGSYVRAWPVSQPIHTVVARDADGLVCPPLLVPAGGGWNESAASVSDPFRARTSRESEGLVQPWPMNAMVMRNNTARGDPGQMCTPVSEAMRTLTSHGHQSLIRWDNFVYGYDTGQLRPVTDILPTQTTKDGDALIGPEVDVNACTFRMLEPHEIQAAMAFTPGYDVLGNRRERIRQLGNAVTPPAARDLIAALTEAITANRPGASK